MEGKGGKGGNVDILFPYATLKPIKKLLLQLFISDKFSKDSSWGEQLLREVYNIPITACTKLKSAPSLSMHDIMKLKVGDVILTNTSPDDEVIIDFYSLLAQGQLGKRGEKLAVLVNDIIPVEKKRG
jgi:flagellar motor switch protein FliM